MRYTEADLRPAIDRLTEPSLMDQVDDAFNEVYVATAPPGVDDSKYGDGWVAGYEKALDVFYDALEARFS